MAILVTGGAGYIGSHTVRALRQLGREVVVLDSLELGVAESVIDAPLIVGNITDADLVVGGVRGVRRHPGSALRRVQVGRRVDGVSSEVLAEQRRRHS